MKILLTASGGGHLEQLKQLDALREENDVIYVVAKNQVNRSMKNVHFVPEYHTETKILKYFDLLKIFIVSYRLLRKYKPDVVISTGVAATFPICWLQKKAFGKKVIFIESFAKKTSGSKTGMMVYQFADYFIVQWEELKSIYPNSIYGGMIY